MANNGNKMSCLRCAKVQEKLISYYKHERHAPFYVSQAGRHADTESQRLYPVTIARIRLNDAL